MASGASAQQAASSQQSTAQAPPVSAEALARSTPTKLDINEYRIEGAHLLPQDVVEQAVYPYLGLGRTTDDVEKARAALEKAYNDAGYQTVGVEIPQQKVQAGVVTLRVVEGAIGKLRVNGSRFYSL